MTVSELLQLDLTVSRLILMGGTVSDLGVTRLNIVETTNFHLIKGLRGGKRSPNTASRLVIDSFLKT